MLNFYFNYTFFAAFPLYMYIFSQITQLAHTLRQERKYVSTLCDFYFRQLLNDRVQFIIAGRKEAVEFHSVNIKPLSVKCHVEIATKNDDTYFLLSVKSKYIRSLTSHRCVPFIT